MSDFAATFERSAFGRRFRFAERGTTPGRDTVAGMTTFIVMSYIIFVNPAILGFAGVEGLEGAGLPFDAVLTSTCLVAGVMTIIMGLYTNMAYAIAPGLGLNAVVAFTLVADNGLGFPEAMGLVVIEGLAITALVILGLRESIMRAIPLELKKAIAVGIGLFIAFIGLYNSGLVQGRETPTPVDLTPFTTWSIVIVLFGLLVTMGLRARGFPGDLLVGIVLKAGYVDERGEMPEIQKPLLVDSAAAAVGGFASASSATTYIESASGVGVGGRTGWVSVVTGALFFPFMFFAPIIGMVPPQATAAALVIVGWLMISALSEAEERAEPGVDRRTERK